MNKNEKKESRGFFTAIYTVAAIFLIMAFAFSVLKVSNHPQENANNDVVEDSAPVDKSNVAPLTTTEATTLEETTTEATTKHMFSPKQQLFLTILKKWNTLLLMLKF